MTRNELTQVPAFYQGYINQLPELSLTAALHHSLESLNARLEEKLTAIGDEVYAPGKWTVPVILQHIIDTERIMSYRALRFARRDRTALPGFDENDYAAQMLGTTQSVNDLLEELKVVRVSTILLFSSFDDETLQQAGPANGNEISVGALGFVVAGHQLHHLNVIEERYLPLAKGIISPF